MNRNFGFKDLLIGSKFHRFVTMEYKRSWKNGSFGRIFLPRIFSNSSALSLDEYDLALF
jgi:hypothetical protein